MESRRNRAYGGLASQQKKHRMKPWLCVSVIGVALAAAPCLCRADDTVKNPGEHLRYAVELEPHGLVGWDAFGWGGFGFGVGGRASIPLMHNGFVQTINNLPAITFGADWAHFGGSCGFALYAGSCSANYFYFPVGLQWNFFVAKKWSVFAEAGFAPFFGSYEDYCDVYAQTPGVTARDIAICQSGRPNRVNVQPWGSVGARYHFSKNAALTMRVGVPSFVIGVSFF